MQQSDVLIVGGGPAGARAAYRLARAGCRVTLFDHTHPREKPCGGGLTGRVLDLLAPVLAGLKPCPAGAVDEARDDSGRDASVGQGSSLAGGLSGVPAASLRFESGRAGSEFALPQTALVIVDRRTFDGTLLDAACRAGAAWVRERVRDVRVGRDGVEVRTTAGCWRGALLAGADGAVSLVRRRVIGPFTRAQMSIATGCFVHGVTSTQVRICMLAEPAGYIWSFPRATHLAVGICAQADRATPAVLRERMNAWLDGNHLADGRRREPYAWPIPSLSSADFACERPAGDRWLLLGDAAGLVDPLTREGIYYALASADLAADTIVRTTPLRAYEARLREEIYPELARAADVKARFFTSGFSDLMVRGFERSAAVRDVMIDLVAGRQPYATLKRRLVATLEVGLALRLLGLEVGGRLRRVARSADSRR